MKVLVVDDDLSFRSMVSVAFSHLGLGTVDEAENGRDGVLKFINAFERGEPYSAVLLDYDMPIMNGRETFNMIRMFEQDHPRERTPTAVLLISSRTDIRDIFADVLESDSHLGILGKSIDFSMLTNRFSDSPPWIKTESP